MSDDRRIPAGEVAAWLRDFAGAVAEAVVRDRMSNPGG